MGELGKRDLRAALDFLAHLGAARDLDDFGTRLALGLRQVVPCDFGSYNEMNVRRRRVRWIADLETSDVDIAAFERHMPANPLLIHVAKHPNAGAFAPEDLVSERQWRELGVYRDLYRPLRLEKILALALSAPPTVIGIAAFRGGGAFTDRDRAMLTLLRPHLMTAYRNAATFGDLAARLAAVEQGLDVAGLGLVLLKPDHGVETMTVSARALFARYFDSAGDVLPEPVCDWLRAAAAQPLAKTAPTPLTVDRGGRRLTVRRLHAGARAMLLIQERGGPPRPEALAPLGLTRREAEVACFLPLGKSDAAIAALLEISPRTVSHLLERVYRKLQVDSRAAAAAAIIETAM